MHFFGRAICHQLEDRSLLIDGKPLSVCARCTGIYIGVFSTLAYLHLFKRKANITIPSIKMSFFLLLLMAPMIMDGFGSYLNLFESNNVKRLITGISFGLALPFFLYPLLSEKSLEVTSVPVIKKSREFIYPLLISTFIGALTWWGKIPYLILNGLMVTIIIIWFNLCLSFLFARFRTNRMKWTLSAFSSLVFLSILSLLHQLVLA